MTVQRWKCTSYCLCGSRKGHFEKSDDEGVWVRYEAAHALEQENERLRKTLVQWWLDVGGASERLLGETMELVGKRSSEPQSAPQNGE